MAHVMGAHFVAFSAVLSGVKEIRQVVREAEADARGGGSHDPLRRRDPRFKPRAAGRFCRTSRRHHRADRRHHREPSSR